MITINVNVDSSKYNDLMTVLKTFKTSPGTYMPNTVAELDNYVTGAAETLENYFLGKGKLVGTEPIPDKYAKSRTKLAKSISVTKTSPLSAVISASDPLIEKIQNGQRESEFDMKTVYPYGKRSRVSRDKNGAVKSNYLIICFRWGASGDESAHFSNTIPTKIYRTQTSNMSLSFRTGKQHPEENSKGMMIMRDEYKWGDRVDEKNAIAIEKSRVWKGKQLTSKVTNSGMVRMMNDAGGSTFVTFRVISTKSPKDSWIRRYDEIKPIDINAGFNKTLEMMKDVFAQRITAAAYEDIMRLIKSIR